METKEKTIITVETIVNVPVEKAWECWSNPSDIINWCSASPDWHTPRAENDLRVGGKFTTRMEAKDGSMGFDFGGEYDAVIPNEYIEYTIGDGRRVEITFTARGNKTHIVESFEAEDMNPVEMQRGGWQAIMDNYKKYTEGK